MSDPHLPAELRASAGVIDIEGRPYTGDLLRRAAAEIERLRCLIGTVACPAGGWNGMPKELEGCCEVIDCVKHKTCGCSLGAALTPQQQSTTS